MFDTAAWPAKRVTVSRTARSRVSRSMTAAIKAMAPKLTKRFLRRILFTLVLDRLICGRSSNHH